MEGKSTLQIVELAFAGKSAKQISKRLRLKTKDVKKVLASARRKLGFRDPSKLNSTILTAAEVSESIDSSLSPSSPIVMHPQKITLPMGQNDFLLQPAMAELIECTQRVGGDLEVTLTGLGDIRPDTALSIWHILQRRAKQMRLSVVAQSSLIDADLLLFIAGDHRWIRPDAWACFERPDRTCHNQFSRSRTLAKQMSGYQTDYAAVYRIITKFLPPEFAGRRIHAGELTEWLIDKEPMKTERHCIVPVATVGPQFDKATAEKPNN